jgi:hypothetical protein
MKTKIRGRLTSGPGLAALAAACVLYVCPQLSGCAGGTSSEVGNPSLTLNFRSEGKPVAFDGYLWIVTAGSNPEFYYAHPDDGTTPPAGPPVLVMGTDAGFGPSTIRLKGSESVTLDRRELTSSLFERDQLRLMKVAAGGRALGDFNIILQPTGSGDSLGGWLAEVRPEPHGYRTADGDSGTEFTVDLTPGHRCSGEVDTTSAAGKPLALFVPGSPYYAMVHAGRFVFVGLPAGRLPLRWVSGKGRVFAVPESLGIAGGGETPLAYSLPDPVHAGEQIDSIAIPDPNPVLPLPVASPQGEYTFSDSVTVTLTAAPGASIYYTYASDGAAPTQDSNRYEKPIVLRSSVTLRAVAYAPGFEHSPVSVNNYKLAPALPSFTPGAGSFVDSVRVAISGPAGSSIYYTLDGSTPTVASTIYTGEPIVVRATTLIQAITVTQGLGASAVVSSQYVIVPDTSVVPPPHP